MADSVSIFWFRHDLRLADNVALLAAVKNSNYVVPIYIWSREEEGAWTPGAASKYWLHQSLERLNDELEKLGSQLTIREGKILAELKKLISETGAKSAYWNKRFDPSGREQDENIREKLERDGIEVETFNSSLLHDPEKVRNKSGTPFKVFTPFWNHLSSTIDPPHAAKKPTKIPFPQKKIKSVAIESLELKPDIDWAGGIREFWKPGEAGAHARLKKFIANGVRHYSTGRDTPGVDGVSMMSPYLHFGEIGPRQIWHAIKEARAKSSARTSFDVYLKEIGWREFAHHILFHFPHTADRPLRAQFEKFPWKMNDNLLKAWQKGMTGYPIVDAGMRQLWHTGWMHNRVRMIVASFLTKDLLISWKYGAAWFWDTLVDADLANNTLGWQWTAGCGADAAPYFRIFNPELQGEKFDPNGDYIREWLPELAKMPAKWIHKPSKAPPMVLLEAKVVLGDTYPKPVIDHSLARKRALEALSVVGATHASPGLNST